MFFGAFIREIRLIDRKQARKLAPNYESSRVGSRDACAYKKGWLGEEMKTYQLWFRYLNHLDGDKEWKGEGANDEKYRDNPEIQQR